MVSNTDFALASSEARTYAKVFIDEHWPKEDLAGGTDDLIRRKVASPLLAALTPFVISNFDCKVVLVKRLPKKNFASWLCVYRQQQYSIAIDKDQIISWEQQNGMPWDLQRIRSIAHEIGHLVLTFGKREGANPKHNPKQTPQQSSVGEFVDSVSAREEEKAWVFAMVFLGVILGHYAYKCRTERPDGGIDRTPQVRA